MGRGGRARLTPGVGWRCRCKTVPRTEYPDLAPGVGAYTPPLGALDSQEVWQMTRNRAAIDEAILEDRWHMATTELRQFEDESTLSECNSEALEAVLDGIRELATRMVHEIRGDQEESALDHIWYELEPMIEARIKQFARGIEAGRTAVAA